MNQDFAVDQSQPLDLLQVSFFWLNAGSDVSIFLPILTIWDLSSFLCVQDSFSFFSEVLLTFHLIISLTGSSFALSSSFIFQYSKKLSKVFLIVLMWPTNITKKIVKHLQNDIAIRRYFLWPSQPNSSFGSKGAKLLHHHHIRAIKEEKEKIYHNLIMEKLVDLNSNFFKAG